MDMSLRRAGGGNRVVPEGHACWRVVARPAACCAARCAIWCAAWWVGQTLLSAPAAAQAPTASRQELMRQWDIDRDGKVDASEAEIARGRMRRARTDTIMNSGPDPVTGRPRVATDPVTGRPLPPDATASDRGRAAAPAEDDELILVPGNGERPRATGAPAVVDDMPPRPSQRDRAALPGTRAPVASPTIPSVSPRPSAGAFPDANPNASVPDARRRLSGASPMQNPAMRGSPPPGAGQERQQPGTRPGIIAGGVRAGAPGARPGYGAGGSPADFNAGRSTGQTPYVPQPGVGPYRGPVPPGTPAIGPPTVPRPGMGQPVGGRSATRTPNTAPRGPRMTTDEFYGR